MWRWAAQTGEVFAPASFVMWIGLKTILSSAETRPLTIVIVACSAGLRRLGQVFSPVSFLYPWPAIPHAPHFPTQLRLENAVLVIWLVTDTRMRQQKRLPQSGQPSITCHYRKGSPKRQAGLEGGLLVLKNALQSSSMQFHSLSCVPL